MDNLKDLVIFSVENQRFALNLSKVEIVIESVDFQKIPIVADHISGTINYRGEYIPLINMRKLFHLQDREVDLDDHFIIVHAENMKLSLWVDHVEEIYTVGQHQILNTEKIMLPSGTFEGLVKLNDGIAFIQNIDQILTPDQIVKIKEAIQKIRE